MVDDFGDWKNFVLNASSGILEFQSAPDFENPKSINDDNRYVIKVSVSDGSGPEDNLIASELIINVKDADEENPVFGIAESTALIPDTHKENQVEVTELNATDDMSSVFRYEISGGSDASSFEINATSNLLSFKEAPDYEDPRDIDGRGDYQVFITVFDEANRSAELELFLEIEPVDEDPYLVTDKFYINEDINDLVDILFNDPDDYPKQGIPEKPIITSNGTLGQLVDQNGTFYYYPNKDVSGTDNLEIARLTIVTLPLSWVCHYRSK